jgi:predicted DNA binding protein
VDAERVESALSNSDLVGGAERIDEVNGLALITLDWDSSSEGFVDVVTRTGATILEGYCEDGWWTFRMRFAEFQSLSTFYNDCTEAGISLEVRRLHDLADQNPDTPYGLTEEQHRTLLVALERGYFAIPRETTLVELSEQLGISDTATSQRIRRGLASVLTSTLT